MEVRTMRLFTPISVQTLFQLEIVRMEFLFLPSMRIGTPVFKRASVFVTCDEILGLPILAHIFAVREYLGLPPVVLPVVCIYANIALMVIFPVRTPYCFKMKDIEVQVGFKFLNQLNT